MSDPNHPSQAEGEDTAAASHDVDVEATDGHPSQAEGEDPADPGEGQDVAAEDKVSDA